MQKTQNLDDKLFLTTKILEWCSGTGHFQRHAMSTNERSPSVKLVIPSPQYTDESWLFGHTVCALFFINSFGRFPLASVVCSLRHLSKHCGGM